MKFLTCSLCELDGYGNWTGKVQNPLKDEIYIQSRWEQGREAFLT